MTAISLMLPPTARGHALLEAFLAVWCARASGHGEPAVQSLVTSTTDQDDIRASRNGDHDAYARLIRRYRDKVSARMWKFTRDRNDFEELVHEAFVEVYFALPRYREMGSFPAWLDRIATRVGYRFWRRKRREPRTVPLESWHRVDEPQDHDPDGAAERLHRMMATLSPRDRLVLTLLYWEGFSVAEIANQTGWTKTLVKVQAHRARARLRKKLEQAKQAAGGTGHG